MLLKVLAYVWIINFDIDAGSLEDIWIANSRQFKKLWRLHTSSAQHNLSFRSNKVFFTFVHESYRLGNPPVCFVLENHFSNQRVYEQLQIWSLAIRIVVRRGGITSLSTLRRYACERCPDANIGPGKMTVIRLNAEVV